MRKIVPRKNILTLLAGGDRRRIGRADEVAALVFKTPKLFPKLIAGLWSDDPLIRMRAADACEKVTRENPGWLLPYKKELLGLLAEALEQEMRWHLAAMAPRLPLNPGERQLVFDTLHAYLDDRSSIVKTFALQAMFDLAQHDAHMRSTVTELLREATRTGTAAMKARSRKLLARLDVL